ncbi:MAG: AbrB family transcriptional regulator [Pseudorhodobacter sp.]
MTYKPSAGFTFALLVGGCGGALFYWFRLPLPWMLGAMMFSGLAAILHLPVRGWVKARPPMSMIIGTMLGSQFSPHTLDQALHWWPAILGLAAYLLVATSLSYGYLRRVVQMDRPTAYFSAMPGGLIDMVLLGAERGADERTIALMHSARIFLVVLGLPALMQLATGADAGSRNAIYRPFSDFSLIDLGWFLVAVVGGLGLGKLCRLPAPFLIGPMLASMVLHWAGISAFTLPTIVIAGAQVVLGTTVGCRFIGTAPARTLRILAVAAGSTVLLLVVALLFSLVLAQVIDIPVEGILLAFSPGGLAEMSLVALALNIEVAFVVLCHICRIGMVIVFAGLMSGFLDRAGR